jgi:hypothetical protein
MDSRPSDETLLLAVAERDMVMLGAPGLPGWSAWWGLVAGAGQVLAPGLVPRRLRLRAFALYWASILAMSILLLAGR